MQPFHEPGEEKRMVVILDPKDYMNWLSCSVAEAVAYLNPWHGPLEGAPALLPPRLKVSRARPGSEPPPATGDLF